MVLGTEAHLDYFSLVMPSLQNYVGDPVNCSLRGHWTKLFNPSNNAIEVTLIPPIHSPLLVKILSGISIATVVLAGLWYCRKASVDLSHALAWVVMLLASPIAWDHYLILLVFPLILIWRNLGPGSRWGILLLILIICVQARNPYSHPSEGVIRTFHWPFTVTILSYQTYALLATGLWMVFLIRHEDRPPKNLPDEA
ncbi:MAG: hypothetical protein HUJ26_01750, partial [Planctomycetaceae bacterium]|nr:hypothetical protein [Planctomycetaceae bacterium]